LQEACHAFDGSAMVKMLNETATVSGTPNSPATVSGTPNSPATPASNTSSTPAAPTVSPTSSQAGVFGYGFAAVIALFTLVVV
jgi:hypothetical protein